MSRLNEIHDYLISIGKDKEGLLACDRFTVYLSMEIMEYAHRNQKRENGDDYAVHPTNAFNNYQKLVGIDSNDPFCIDKDLMMKHGIPYEGVQEVCLLHDVIEDTDFTISDLEDIFDECKLGDYFRLYMKDALIRVTHQKTQEYWEYLKVLMENPISSLVKMMDLQDNLYVLSLNSFNQKNYDRAKNYLDYLYAINESWHFIENASKYKEEYKNN